MSMRAAVIVSMGLALIPAADLALAQTQAPKPVIYKLDKDARLQRGCFGPCLCPVLIDSALRGTFVLTFQGFDGLYDNYAVTDIHWTAIQPDGTKVPITGAGTYRIGGEVAVQQELSLDLTVGSDPPTRYDSGLVSGPSDFPRIDLAISINGGVCFDTVISVRSRPAMLLAVGRGSLSWDAVPQAASYDLVRGDLRALLASGGDFTIATLECVAAGTASTSVSFQADPAPGEAFWFLARWADGTMDDTWDEDDPAQSGSCEQAIEASPAACP